MLEQALRVLEALVSISSTPTLTLKHAGPTLSVIGKDASENQRVTPHK